MNEAGTDEVPLTLFTSEPSQHLKCPVCQKLYRDPVINISCGHTFCQLCANATSHCPIDGNQCEPTQLVVNKYAHQGPVVQSIISLRLEHN